MARFWLHCRHLTVGGRKMSKSKGTVYYTDTLLAQGYTAQEIRFFLICGHYRTGLSYSDRAMRRASARLKEFKTAVGRIRRKTGTKPGPGTKIGQKLKRIFSEKMDDDLNVEEAFAGLHAAVAGIDSARLEPDEASGIMAALKEIDGVLKVIF
jgi:cysteinyl-tRNA synthetase